VAHRGGFNWKRFICVAATAAIRTRVCEEFFEDYTLPPRNIKQVFADAPSSKTNVHTAILSIYLAVAYSEKRCPNLVDFEIELENTKH